MRLNKVARLQREYSFSDYLAGLGFRLGRSDPNLRGHHEEEGRGVFPLTHSSRLELKEKLSARVDGVSGFQCIQLPI